MVRDAAHPRTVVPPMQLSPAPSPPRKTPAAARELGVSSDTLCGLIRRGKLDPLPTKDSSGDYIWSESDLDRARAALAARRQPAKPQTTTN
jgi:hypothetical protein